MRYLRHFLNSVHSNKGLSLVEVIVGLGVAAIMFYGLSNIQLSSIKFNESIKQDMSYNQFLGEIQLILKSPDLCSDSLKNAATSGSEVTLYKPGSSQSSVLFAQGSKYDKWTINSAKFTALNNLTTADTKLGTLTIEATKDDAIAVGTKSRSKDFLIKLKVDGSNKVQNCWSEATIQQNCEEIGGDYNESRTPKCLITAANLGQCTGTDVITGFDASGNKICTPVATLTPTTTTEPTTSPLTTPTTEPVTPPPITADKVHTFKVSIPLGPTSGVYKAKCPSPYLNGGKVLLVSHTCGAYGAGGTGSCGPGYCDISYYRGTSGRSVGMCGVYFAVTCF